jgi:hypothetical protein
MYKGIFVDDRADQATYAKSLSEVMPEQLCVGFSLPNERLEEMADTLLKAHWDFIALDFRLDESPVVIKAGEPAVNRYRASPIAQHLRDRIIDNPENDLPLILLSNEDKIKNMFRHDTTAEDLFDLVVPKEQVADSIASAGIVARKIVDLADAYKVAKNVIKDGKSKFVMQLSALTNEDEGYVLDHQSIRAVDRLDCPHQIIPRIEKLMIDRPGILVSQEHLLAKLGVATDSVDLENLREALRAENTDYRGILSAAWPRWWWHRVDSLMRKLLDRPLQSMTGAERVIAINKVLGISLTPARSTTTDTSDEYFWVACASCKQPTELDHSVTAYDSYYEPFFEPTRICWRCIKTGEYAKPNLGLEVDDSDRSVASDLQHKTASE